MWCWPHERGWEDSNLLYKSPNSWLHWLIDFNILNSDYIPKNITMLNICAALNKWPQVLAGPLCPQWANSLSFTSCLQAITLITPGPIILLFAWGSGVTPVSLGIRFHLFPYNPSYSLRTLLRMNSLFHF